MLEGDRLVESKVPEPDRLTRRLGLPKFVHPGGSFREYRGSDQPIRPTPSSVARPARQSRALTRLQSAARLVRVFIDSLRVGLQVSPVLCGGVAKEGS